MDVLTKEQRTRNMQAIRNKNTRIELILAKKLFSLGYRYRRNDKTVYGRPDISIKKYKIAIFCDSEYFHGKDWDVNKKRIQSNRDFWYDKIESNIKRDRVVNETLLKNGWKVLRFWGEDIKKNADFCTSQIVEAIEERKHGKVL
ncbi:MAG TPA: very short patch repair endonuclease [Bacteroidales bacterium]|jgi:DNA mismatch endonuclease (patch repair protein)|nr:very short patch repair endonuclease [Bacteroidales bacterium]